MAKFSLFIYNIDEIKKNVNPVPNFTIPSVTIQLPEVIQGYSFVLYCLMKLGTGSNTTIKIKMQKQPQTIEEKKEKALKYAYRILRMRMKTYFEIKQKLKQRKAEPEIIQYVIKNLEEQGLLNDEKFAEAWIKDRLYFHPCGRLLINKKMREKGIDEKIIKKNLDKFLPQEKEKKIAMEILKRKKGKMKSDLPKEKIFQKMNMFLAGKGFPGNIVFEILNQ